ncbi:hypothetical protein TCAL_10016 [Tigriopus californicus]|uniref:tRNA (uracil-O(2)-)-methyltransferase n=1 Tax=Tigriopus californicus TaxID=6832 RepID=A0A553NXJ8_TIGCA|nr:hypothetical protein TCAL_10016 [Tigriopus californicus]|eukprot:TCALIF_10016-PA protein Name:"Similar to Trmt44 Probable tRNA (uracil-O(2)-)-methyltransferase (Mus musculus)" AED:0.03 eAED:0.03 QI:904/0.8/0.66/1/0.8/0.66/6/0/569
MTPVVVVQCSVQRFTRALDILVRKPHASQKKLAGCTLTSLSIYQDQPKSVKSVSEVFDEAYGEIRRRLVFRKISSEAQQTDYDETIKWIHPSEQSMTISFHCDHHEFLIQYLDSQISFHVVKGPKDAIRHNYVDPLVKWCQGVEEITPSPTSNRLVDLAKYRDKYCQLKDKHAPNIIKDLALAAYIILLWEQDDLPKEQIRFMDLGCGNGLLVYILTVEGYDGTGVDIRQRKIWDSFKPKVDLQVSTVHPSATTTFPKYTWLIGNHSDELTPWIPVMAALTSHQTRFFVLPCCPFEFHRKFVRRNPKASIYRDYLDYVKEVGEKCGFVMEEDRLKIPSTKRICFIGRQRVNLKETRPEILQAIHDLNSTSQSQGQCEKNDLVHAKRARLDFVPRSSEIAVHNCTQLPKELITDVIKLVVSECLKTQNLLMDHSKFSNLKDESLLPTKEWNMGGTLSLSEIAALISYEQLQAMKNECGGLQTLIRNHNFIFIVDKGQVRLRCHALDPPWAGKRHSKGSKSNVGTTATHLTKKTRLCWFFENHPQGCSVSADKCLWAHGKHDLAAMTTRND